MSLSVAPRATVTVLRGLIDEARRKGYAEGVFGVRAQPVWAEADEFVHDGVSVRVVPCVSALAVREALLDRTPGTWLVVLTDRTEDDLGPGLCAHLLWNRLRTPDPWAIVRQGFAATGIDPALTNVADSREVATGLLAVAPREPDRWPAAPAGVLTRDHAFTAVAVRTLGLTGPVGAAPDVAAVFDWSLQPDVADRLAALRIDAGDVVADALVDWVAGRAGSAATFLRSLLRAGELRDVVPLGLVIGLLAEAQGSAGAEGQTAREALVRLESRFSGRRPDGAVASSWGQEAAAAVRRAATDGDHRTDHDRALGRADDLLVGVQASRLAARSTLLASGLTARLAVLAEALHAAAVVVPAGTGTVVDGPLVDGPLVAPERAAAVEAAWKAVVEHSLWGANDPRHAPSVAAVRLTRWLAAGSAAEWARYGGVDGFVVLSRRHLDVDAWVDSALHDAERGVADADLGSALAAVLTAARVRRAAHDTAFATALADHTRTGQDIQSDDLHHKVVHLEDVLPSIVLPVVRQAPVLLLVLDGMSAAVATEVLAAATGASSGWVEALWKWPEQRVAALAVLPTLTTVSRTSLLSGELRTGEQREEQAGFAAVTGAYGVRGVLFHKRELDTSKPGHELADDVAAAIDDIDGRHLVACVLNTIDDALDRSDPGGTDWNLATIKHLRPLLDRARLAGRVVVLTSDHGHVIERRAGTQRSFAEISSGRSRAAASGAAGEGEVLVEGRRVLEHGGRAVLAVDELLRYGPLKAGYHGGASPAEVVVPVAFLVPGAVPEGADLLVLAPPQEPVWWSSATGAAVARAAEGLVVQPAVPAPSKRTRSRATPSSDDSMTLFDVAAPDPAAAQAQRAPVADAGTLFAPLADAVVTSATFAAQKRLAGRGIPEDDQVRAALTALLGAPANRLSQAQFAAAMRVAVTSVFGVLPQVQRLLNVEGYPVIARDADGVTVVLDEALLREQFGVDP